MRGLKNWKQSTKLLVNIFGTREESCFEAAKDIELNI